MYVLLAGKLPSYDKNTESFLKIAAENVSGEAKVRTKGGALE